MSTPVPTVFISYSHKDEAWKNRLVSHLRMAGAALRFDIWDDERIAASQDWHAEIEHALSTARVAVLLVSVDFLNSPFIREVEVPRLLRRRRDEGVPLVPVLVRACPWDAVDWLRSIQMRPKGMRPLAEHTEPEIEAQFVTIAKEIAALVYPHGAAPTPEGDTAPATQAADESDSGRIFGREDKIATILERLRQPGGCIVVIDGLGGVGKTTLAHVIRRRSERDCHRTLKTGQAGTVESVPRLALVCGALRRGDPPQRGPPWRGRQAPAGAAETAPAGLDQSAPTGRFAYHLGCHSRGGIGGATTHHR